MAVLKVDTDNASITANLTGQAVILVSDNECRDLQNWPCVFIGDVKMCLTSH
jgi:hypothetical protein